MCSLCRLPVAKNHTFGQILTFGSPVPTPFYRWGSHLVCYSRLTAYAYVPNFSLFCCPLAAKKPNFAIFSTSAFSGVASWQQSDKVEHGCTTTNLPYQRYQSRFCTPTPSWRNRAHKLWRSNAWRTNRQTNRQTDKNSTFLAAPAAGEIRAPPNLAWW